MASKKSTFKQRQFLDHLTKELGIDAVDRIKKKLRIKRPILELTSKTCGKLINELLQMKSPNLMFISSMEKSMRVLRKKLELYDFHYEPWMDTDYDENGKFIGKSE